MSVLSAIRAVEIAGRVSPYRPALILMQNGAWTQVSCRMLAEAVETWAAVLASVCPEVPPPSNAPAVAVVFLRHGLAAYASFLGAMRAGMVACFLPEPSPKQEPEPYWASHHEVLARIAPAAVIAPVSLHAALAAILPDNTPVLDPTCDQPLNGPPPAWSDTAALPAVLQHSSGTTGLKKGVVLTHGQIAAQIEAYAAAVGMGTDDVVASWLPLYHDMGLVTGLLMPLAVGATVIAIDPFDWLARPVSILDAVSRFRASFCWLPNFAFAHLVRVVDQAQPCDLSSLRAIIDCSEPCRADTLDAFRARFEPDGLRSGAVQTCYAMAETVFAVTQSPTGIDPAVIEVDGDALSSRAVAVPVHPGSSGSVRIVSCGPPIDGTFLHIEPRAPLGRSSIATSLVESRAMVLPRAEIPVGEVLVLSRSGFAGYHGDPAASAACMHGQWYRTGDLGFIHGGELYVTGRLKDLLIVNGRNFYAQDIEAAAMSVPGAKPGRVVAFAIPRSAAGTDGAVVLVEPAEPAISDAKRAALSRSVSDAVFAALALVPHTVRIVPPGSLIKTTSGKPCRHENRRRHLEGAKP